MSEDMQLMTLFHYWSYIHLIVHFAYQKHYPKFSRGQKSSKQSGKFHNNLWLTLFKTML